jgi:hypothetical protein
MTDKDIDDAIAKLIDDARTFREAIATVKRGGFCHNDTWAMVPVAKAKEAGLI